MTRSLLLAWLLVLPVFAYTPANAQAPEIRQLLLNVEKLRQLRAILSDMQQGYEILQRGYGAIRDISQGSFNLHETFLDGLWAVNPALRQYSQVADIIALQQALLQEHREAFRRFRQSGHFTPEEVEYIGQVYAHLANRSLQHLDELTLVLTSGALRMSDDERLELIHRIYRDTRDNLDFLRHFNREATLLALRRERERISIRGIRPHYPPLEHLK
ncbi:TerB family tellurite resistance protein [Pontibacter sp. Tf4]|nr:TerB family tellurite resistance protein [Pontibacter sp. Tf4]